MSHRGRYIVRGWVSLFVLLFAGAALAQKRTRDLPSSQDGSCSSTPCMGDSSVFLDNYENVSVTDSTGVVGATVQVFRWGSILPDSNGNPTNPVINAHTLLQVVLPSAAGVASESITAVAISTTNGAQLQNPWYGFNSSSVTFAPSPIDVYHGQSDPSYTKAKLNLMQQPAGFYNDGSSNFSASSPDFISAAYPITGADTNTTIWTFGPPISPSTGSTLSAAVLKTVVLLVDSIPSTSPPPLANILSPAGLTTGPSFNSTSFTPNAPITVNGLDSLTASNIAIVVHVTYTNGNPAQDLVLGNLALTGGVMACPAAASGISCRSNPTQPLVINTANFSETVRLDNAQPSTAQLSYQIPSFGNPTYPACSAFSSGGATTLARTISYQYQPAASGNFTIDTSGSYFDTVLLVSSLTDTNFKTPACFDDQANGILQAKATNVALKTGNTYTITVGEFPEFQEDICDPSAQSGCPALSPLSAEPVLHFTLTSPADATSTSVNCTTPEPVGAAVTCTSKVTDTTTSSTTPTGTVQFTFTLSGSSTPAVTLMGTLAGGSTQVNTSSLLAGTYSVSASFQASGTFLGSMASTPLVVNLSQATVTASASSSNPVAGAAFNIIPGVAGVAGLPAPTGTISLLDGGVATGITGTVASTTLAVTNASVGAHSYTVAYSGDSVYAAGTSAAVPVTVGKDTSAVKLSSSAASLNVNTALTLTATVTNSSGTSLAPTGTVTFFNGSSMLGTGMITSGVATLKISSFSSMTGTFSLTASYAGDGNFNLSSSSAVSVTVVTPLAISTASVPGELQEPPTQLHSQLPAEPRRTHGLSRREAFLLD